VSVLTVGLTGGIATGKSVVAEVMRRRGWIVESADRVASELMKPRKKAWRVVVSRFGPAILNADKTIDRKKLASIIFADEKERLFLNSVVHPLVMAARKRAVRRLGKSGRAAVYVAEAALTVEAGFAGFFDKVVVTDCPKSVQIRRLRARDGISRDEALRRIGAQLTRSRRRRHADFVIDTSGTLGQTVRRAEEVCEQLSGDALQK
jgi:dephospho-CoA kinase